MWLCVPRVAGGCRAGAITTGPCRHCTTGGAGINIVSKRKIKPTPEAQALLAEKFSKIEANRMPRENTDTVKEEGEDVAERRVGDGASNRVILLITHFNVFLYSTCFFIQSGTLPYLTKKLGADPVTFGSLQTAFSVCQLLGGPVYGRMGDVLGERTALIIAFISTTLTYLITGLSYSIPVLFLSRLFSVMMHVMQGSQMVATSLSSKQSRAGALARLGFSYGLGVVVGPSLGGIVTQHLGEQSAVLLSAVGSMLSLCLVVVFVPRFTKEKKHSKNSVLDIKKMVSLAVQPSVRGVLLIKAVCGIPIGILQSMLAVIAMDKFGLAPDQNGYLMSYIGLLSLFMEGVGVSLVTSRLSDVSVIKLSATTLAISYYALSLLTGLTDFLVLLAPIVFSLSLINSVISSTLTKVVQTEDTGCILGINMAVNSMIRTFAPTLGGWMLGSLGFQSIGLLGTVCNLAVLFLARYLHV